MSLFRVVIPKSVQKELDRLSGKEWERVTLQIVRLKDNPRPPGCVKLRGQANEYRIRIGNYRVRYEIRENSSEVIILHCLHRKNVYRI